LVAITLLVFIKVLPLDANHIAEAVFLVYLVIFGVIGIFAELDWRITNWFFDRVSFLRAYSGRAIFYLFIGSLAAALRQVHWLMLMVGCIVMATGILCGIAACCNFFGSKKGDKTKSKRGKEMKEPVTGDTENVDLEGDGNPF